MAKIRSSSGFTIAELITVTAIVGILAAVALPVTRFAIRRERETELRDRLARFTWAIDRYTDLRLKGLIKAPPDIGQAEYPKSLDDLTKPIELIDGKKVVLLRKRDLIDPMTGKEDWRTVSSTDDPDSISSNGRNVFDVHSSSHALSLDGKTHYDEW